VHLLIMLTRLLKVLIAIVLSLMFTVSLVKIVLLIWSSYPDWLHPHSTQESPSSFTADEWLAYQQLLRDKGKSSTRIWNCCQYLICVYAMQIRTHSNQSLYACKDNLYVFGALLHSSSVCVYNVHVVLKLKHQ